VTDAFDSSFKASLKPPSGVKIARFVFRVGYIDTDRATVMHHAAYLRYLEAARVDFFREHGLDYNALERDRGLGLPVVDANLRYKSPAMFDDQLTITSWVSLVTRARLRFDATIHRDGGLITQARITLCCAELKGMRVCSVPQEIRDMFGTYSSN
jgi:acyl-CoA thioester hydrolase